MPVERTSTFQQTVPRRPALADVLNGTKENGTRAVPPHMLAAEEFEQVAALVVALGKMAPLIRITLAMSAPDLIIASFASVRDDLIASDFTVFNYGTGDNEIRWTASKFPTSGAQPVVCINDNSTTRYNAPIVAMTSPGGSLAGARVRTSKSDDSAIQVGFTLLVF